MPIGLLLLVALTVVQRLHELRLSARNLKEMQRRNAQQGGKMWQANGPLHYRAMVFSQVALLGAPVTESWLRGREADGFLMLCAVGLWCAGQSLRFWSQRSLGIAWNAKGMVSSTQTVIHSGPYRFLANPNYLGVGFESIAIPLAGAAWFSLVGVNLLLWPLLWQRTRCEQQLLQRL